MYVPPFKYTDRIVNLTAKICRQIESFSSGTKDEDKLRLRKANRIKTIHSSLAVEGNTLTEGQVRDIIDGKAVIAPIREVIEVKNAVAAYELYPTLNPFDVNDLLKAHGVMMRGLIDDAGNFRKSAVGVFGESGCVHVAPPADRVPGLVADLLEWVTKSDVHPLVRSCVFHYEFEFIHPFSDGNGRMGRLWQSLLLGQIHPLFEHLPIENLVFANQQKYHDAIGESTACGESTPFVDFMLDKILETLLSHQGEILNTEIEGVKFLSSFVQTFTEDFARTFARIFARTFAPAVKTKAASDRLFVIMQQVLVLIKTKENTNARSLAAAAGVGDRTMRTCLKRLSDAGIIIYTGTTNNGRWRVVLGTIPLSPEK